MTTTLVPVTTAAANPGINFAGLNSVALQILLLALFCIAIGVAFAWKKTKTSEVLSILGIVGAVILIASAGILVTNGFGERVLNFLTAG